MVEARDIDWERLSNEYAILRGLNPNEGEDRIDSEGPVASDNAESSVSSLPQVVERVDNLVTRQEEDRSRLDGLQQQRHEDIQKFERQQQEDRSRINILETQRHKDIADLQKQREQDRSVVSILEQQRHEYVSNLQTQREEDRSLLVTLEKQQHRDIANLGQQREEDHAYIKRLAANLHREREEDRSQLVTLEKQQHRDIANLGQQREEDHAYIERLAANFHREREEDRLRFLNLEERRREDSERLNKDSEEKAARQTAMEHEIRQQKSTIKNLQLLQVKAERTIVAMEAVSKFQRETIDDIKTYVMRQVDVRSLREEQRAKRLNAPLMVVEEQSRAYTDKGTNTSAKIPATTNTSNGNGSRPGAPDDTNAVKDPTQQIEVRVTNAGDTADGETASETTSSNFPSAPPSFQELLFKLIVFWMFPLAIGRFIIVFFLRGFWLYVRSPSKDEIRDHRAVFGGETTKSDPGMLRHEMALCRVLYYFFEPILLLFIVLGMVYNALQSVLVKFPPGLLNIAFF